MSPEQIRLLAHCLADMAEIARALNYNRTVSAWAKALSEHSQALYESTVPPPEPKDQAIRDAA